jgi:hypothetical protein
LVIVCTIRERKQLGHIAVERESSFGREAACPPSMSTDPMLIRVNLSLVGLMPTTGQWRSFRVWMSDVPLPAFRCTPCSEETGIDQHKLVQVVTNPHEANSKLVAGHDWSSESVIGRCRNDQASKISDGVQAAMTPRKNASIVLIERTRPVRQAVPRCLFSCFSGSVALAAPCAR